MTRYIIDFIDTATHQDIDSYLVSSQATVVKVFSNLKKVYLVDAPSAPAADPIVTSIIDDDAATTKITRHTVVPVTPTPSAGTINLTVAEQKDWWKLYSMSFADTNKPTASLNRYGVGTNVYVVDSGIEAAHAEFAGQSIELLYSLTGEFSDSVGHGTALSSLVVGNTCGITAASLKVVKIFDAVQQTRQSDFLYAFDAILENAAASPNRFSVVNLSWSIDKNVYIEEKIQTLIDAGLAVVTAAGNTGVQITDVTPPAMDDVFTIGSYGPSFTPSNFSSYTDPSIVGLSLASTNSGALDSWAPGEQIWCAGLNGTYGFAAGTSMSAAIYSATLLYNASQLLAADNDVLYMYRTPAGNIDWSKMTNADRAGLLALTDPKYAASANKVNTCVVLAHITPTELTVLMPMQRGQINATVGQVGWNPFYVLNTISAYEIDTPLPSYITLDKNIMTVRPTVNPTDPLGIESVNISYSLFPAEAGSAPIPCTMVVTVSTAAAAPAVSVPPDDPLVPSLILNSKM